MSTNWSSMANTSVCATAVDNAVDGERAGGHRTASTGEDLMKPYDRLTIVRNRHRARYLRIFRNRVQAYFEQLEYDADGLPVDWAAIRAARAEINRMLPWVVQIVEAADLGATSAASLHNPANRAVEIINDIFSIRYEQGTYQEILDVIDMAVGVYDATRFSALTRTFNPFHYLTTALGFVVTLPRRGLVAMGLLRPRAAQIRPDDTTRFEAALSRLAGTEELLETRFAEMREWQARLFAENADQLTDVAERMDFLERVLAQQAPQRRLERGEKKVSTPV
jgi:hypothetical protein